MIYTIAKLRTYTRTIDNRLEDVVKYPDAWVDERIEEGMAIANDIKPVFYTKEKYDLEANITVDLLDEVEIIPQQEVHTVWSVECDLNSFTISITPNNHVIVTRIPSTPIPIDFSVTIRYFFYPTIPFATIEMSMEMYKLVKDGIAVSVFAFLQDKESEQYHQAKAESYVVKSTFDIEKDIMNVPDTRLWTRSWA